MVPVHKKYIYNQNNKEIYRSGEVAINSWIATHLILSLWRRKKIFLLLLWGWLCISTDELAKNLRVKKIYTPSFK